MCHFPLPNIGILHVLKINNSVFRRIKATGTKTKFIHWNIAGKFFFQYFKIFFFFLSMIQNAHRNGEILWNEWIGRHYINFRLVVRQNDNNIIHCLSCVSSNFAFYILRAHISTKYEVRSADRNDDVNDKALNLVVILAMTTRWHTHESVLISSIFFFILFTFHFTALIILS